MAEQIMPILLMGAGAYILLNKRQGAQKEFSMGGSSPTLLLLGAQPTGEGVGLEAEQKTKKDQPTEQSPPVIFNITEEPPNSQQFFNQQQSSSAPESKKYVATGDPQRDKVVANMQQAQDKETKKQPSTPTKSSTTFSIIKSIFKPVFTGRLW